MVTRAPDRIARMFDTVRFIRSIRPGRRALQRPTAATAAPVRTALVARGLPGEPEIEPNIRELIERVLESADAGGGDDDA